MRVRLIVPYIGDNLTFLLLHNVGTINNFGTASVQAFINTGTVTDFGIFNIESTGEPFATNSGIVTVSSSGLLTTNGSCAECW